MGALLGEWDGCWEGHFLMNAYPKDFHEIVEYDSIGPDFQLSCRRRVEAKT